MNIKQNLWKSTVSSRGQDASIFNDVEGNSSLYQGTDPTVFAKNLELINQRIHSIHKELTYWNLYKITLSVNSSADFERIIAALAPGEACIINTNTFTSQGQRYSRGDVFVKTINNELVYVPSVNSGFYYPSLIRYNSTDNVYQLQYSYSTVAPNETSTSTVGIDELVANPASKIIFENLSETRASFIYGNYQEIDSLNPVLIRKTVIDGVNVYPVVKFFLSENNGMTMEEIGLNFSVVSSSDYWSITCTDYDTLFSTNGRKLFMQVK